MNQNDVSIAVTQEQLLTAANKELQEKLYVLEETVDDYMKTIIFLNGKVEGTKEALINIIQMQGQDFSDLEDEYEQT